MAISTLDPADMTGQERMQEIAAILAVCIQRLQNTERKRWRILRRRSHSIRRTHIAAHA